MILQRTNMLKIDGQPMPVPTETADIQYKDVESNDSGADEMGVYHREILRSGVLSCTLTYGYMDNEDCAYLIGLLQGKTTFQFTCPAASPDADVTKTTTRTCYCTNRGAALQRLKSGVWRNMTLQIQEC